MENLTTFEQDQLTEIINIGASHASNALAKMIGRPVSVTVPQSFIGQIEAMPTFVGDTERVMTAVLLKIIEDISGTALLVFPPESARELASLLVKKPRSADNAVLDAADRSALCEVGNILLGAALSALSNFLGLNILQSVPDVATDMLGSVIDAVVANLGQASDTVLGFKIKLAVPSADTGSAIALELFFAFDPVTTGRILEQAKRKISN